MLFRELSRPKRVPSPPSLRAYSYHPANLHTRVCIYILSKLSAGGVLLRIIDLGEMFLFRHENRGGKARRWRDRRIEIMIILFNIFSFFFLGFESCLQEEDCAQRVILKQRLIYDYGIKD